jgi:hypothetical protein
MDGINKQIEIRMEKRKWEGRKIKEEQNFSS